jgi:hypothetical protein
MNLLDRLRLTQIPWAGLRMTKEKMKIFVSCSEEISKDKPNRCGDRWKRRISSIFTYGKMSRESFKKNFQFNVGIWNKLSQKRNSVRHLPGQQDSKIQWTKRRDPI